MVIRSCVITFRLPKVDGGDIHAFRFLNILQPISDSLYLITANYTRGNDAKDNLIIININHQAQGCLLKKISEYFLYQFRQAFHLIRIRNEIDIVIFYIGTVLVFPLLTAKLLGKKVITVVTGSFSKGSEYQASNGNLSKLMKAYNEFCEYVNYRLANSIVVLSPNIINDFELTPFYQKISFNSTTYIDLNLFKFRGDIQLRENLFAFVGRLSPEKGIRNLVHAIPSTANKFKAKFLIIGDGKLMDELKSEVNKNNQLNNVEFKGWVSMSKHPHIYQEIKLLIVPSYTEVIAASALEAMACGAIVVASQVGSTPDFIKDEITGFLMEDNSPEGISRAVERAILFDNKELIVKNARKLIEDNFSYDAIQEQFKKIFENLFVEDYK